MNTTAALPEFQAPAPATKWSTTLNGVLAGGIFAFSFIPGWIALGPVLFSQTLRPYLPICLGMLFIGNVIPVIYVSLRKSAPYTFACACPDSVAVLLASLLASVAASVSSAPALLPTAVAALTVSALLVGAVFFLLGWLKLGGLIRFMPYSVVHGFLAGIGVSLFFFGLSVATGATVTIHDLSALWTKNALTHCAPAVVYSALLYYVTQRWKQSYVLPGILIASILGFFIALRVGGIDTDTAMARGWILGPFDRSAHFWPPLQLTDLTRIEWTPLLHQWGTFFLIAAVSVLELLVYVSGREVMTKQDIDVNQALRLNGEANIFSGLCGGYIGFECLSGPVLSYKLKAPGRAAPLTNAAVTIVVLIFGMSILSVAPTVLLGAIVMFSAFSFLAGPLLNGWHKLPKITNVLVWIVTFTVAYFGFAIGAVCGVLTSLGVFVVMYSRHNVIRFSNTGANLRSSVARSSACEHWLATAGSSIHILRLQGNIFFGTAHNLVASIRGLLTSGSMRYLILDFSQVDGIDASGMASFTLLRSLTEDAGATLIFTRLSPFLHARLNPSKSKDKLNEPAIRGDGQAYWPDTDQALEWCENQLLGRNEANATSFGALIESEQVTDTPQQPRSPTVPQALDAASTSNTAAPVWVVEHERAEYQQLRSMLTRMASYLERRELPAGHTLWNQGDMALDLYFVEAGELHLHRQLGAAKERRIAVYQPGIVIGETGVYSETPRPGTMRVAKDAILYRLSWGALEMMQANEPALAVEFHRYIARVESNFLVNSFRSADFLFS